MLHFKLVPRNMSLRYITSIIIREIRHWKVTQLLIEQQNHILIVRYLYSKKII